MARAAVVGRLDWCWRICSRDGFSHGQKVVVGGGVGGGGGGWQEASGLLPMDPSTRFLECPYSMAADFPRRELAKKARTRQKLAGFSFSDVTQHHLLPQPVLQK